MAIAPVLGLLLCCLVSLQTPAQAWRMRRQRRNGSLLAAGRAARAQKRAEEAGEQAGNSTAEDSSSTSADRLTAALLPVLVPNASVASLAAAWSVARSADEAVSRTTEDSDNTASGGLAAALLLVPNASAVSIAATRSASHSADEAPGDDGGGGGGSGQQQFPGSQTSKHPDYMETPSVKQLLVELPDFHQNGHPQCFEGGGEARVGCTESCPCRWFERCYPKFVLWEGPGPPRALARSPGPGSRQGPRLESIDVGSCNLSVTMLVLLSVALFCAVVAVVFAVRGALFIFAFMADKSKMDLMKQKRPIKISTSYPVSDDLVPRLEQRDMHSAA